MKLPEFTAGEWAIIATIIVILAIIIVPVAYKAKHRHDLHPIWVDNCVEEMREADPSISVRSAAHRCELKWETEILPAMKAGDRTWR